MTDNSFIATVTAVAAGAVALVFFIALLLMSAVLAPFGRFPAEFLGDVR